MSTVFKGVTNTITGFTSILASSVFKVRLYTPSIESDFNQTAFTNGFNIEFSFDDGSTYRYQEAVADPTALGGYYEFIPNFTLSMDSSIGKSVPSLNDSVIQITVQNKGNIVKLSEIQFYNEITPYSSSVFTNPVNQSGSVVDTLFNNNFSDGYFLANSDFIQAGVTGVSIDKLKIKVFSAIADNAFFPNGFTIILKLKSGGTYQFVTDIIANRTIEYIFTPDFTQTIEIGGGVSGEVRPAEKILWLKVEGSNLDNKTFNGTFGSWSSQGQTISSTDNRRVGHSYSAAYPYFNYHSTVRDDADKNVAGEGSSFEATFRASVDTFPELTVFTVSHNTRIDSSNIIWSDNAGRSLSMSKEVIKFEQNGTEISKTSSNNKTLITQVYREGVNNSSGFINGGLVSSFTNSTEPSSSNLKISSPGTKQTLMEFIMFDGAVDEAKRKQVESYLALKYALPLEHDYVSSSGEIIWSGSDFNNDIIGLGRDTVTSFYQKQASYSFLSGYHALILSASDSFAIRNKLNPATIPHNSFLLVGHNGGSMSSFSTTLGTYSTIQRKWKVQKTGSMGAIKLRIVKDSLPNDIITGLIIRDSQYIPVPLLSEVNIRFGFIFHYIDYLEGSFVFSDEDQFTFARDNIVILPVSITLNVGSDKALWY